MPPSLRNRQVVVAGYGASGRAAARALAAAGAGIRVADNASLADLGIQEEAASALATFFTGENQLDALQGADLVIASPGVPASSPLLKMAVARGLPIWSEVELAYRLSKSPMVAITGTNGKTTTTALIGELLQSAGFPVSVAGNIGLPLVEGVTSCPEKGWVVAEISSFQLEWVEEFRPRVALLLNLTPDHLNRHGSLEEYGRIKGRIFARQGQGDTAVLNADDPAVSVWGGKLASRVLYFSCLQDLPEGAAVVDGHMVIRLDGRNYDLGRPDEMKLRGAHNVANVLAAALAAAVCGVDEERLRRTVQSFSGVEHRLEPVAVVDDVEYINDSKGTNPDAAIKAVEAMERPFVLIAGGRDKGTSFMEFGRLIADKAGYLVLMGEAADRIAEAASAAGFRRIERATDMADAVSRAAALAQAGEAVLLSPGCASFDMFKNYEDRGRAFKEAVFNLKKGGLTDALR